MGYYEHRMQGTNVINDAFYDSHDRYSNEKQLAQLLADYSFRLNERGDRISVTGRLRYDWYALEYTESNMFDTTGARYEGTRGYEKEHHWDFDGSAVYEMNYREQGKLEIGYQYTSYSEHGDYNITYWDRAAQDFQWQDDLYAPFFYRRQIHSLYAMLNDRIGPVAFDAGLRADNTLDELAISVAGADRDISRLELFPSLHASYEAPHGNTFSVGYSYRTNRPGIWQLEPYITYEDYYTKQIGNPDIRPEYIHSVEAGYRKSTGKGGSIAVTGFFRSRTGVIDRIRVAYEPGVTLDSLIKRGLRPLGRRGARRTRESRPLVEYDRQRKLFRIQVRQPLRGVRGRFQHELRAGTDQPVHARTRDPSTVRCQCRRPYGTDARSGKGLLLFRFGPAPAIL